MQIQYGKRFIKEYKKCQPKIQKAFKERLELFLRDKNHPLLNNHQLGGQLKDYRSININSDWRLIFQEFNQGDVVYFIVIGTHSQLYS